MEAMLGMGKLDVKALKAAYRGKLTGAAAPSQASRKGAKPRPKS
jgi:hypothetical protein